MIFTLEAIYSIILQCIVYSIDIIVLISEFFFFFFLLVEVPEHNLAGIWALPSALLKGPASLPLPHGVE